MYYIYRTTNLVNGKTYIGKHKYKKLNDNYMGSGKHSEASKKKIVAARKGKHWFNNGEINVICFECPEGYEPGFLQKKGMGE